MILPLILAASTSAAAPDDGTDWNCDDPVAQQEMNYCANKDFEAADARLNAQWKITAAGMKARDKEPDYYNDKRPGFFDTLLAGQRAWLTYRDQHCYSVGYEARGGSMEPMLISGCKTRLTNDRITQLKSLVEEQ